MDVDTKLKKNADCLDHDTPKTGSCRKISAQDAVTKGATQKAGRGGVSGKRYFLHKIKTHSGAECFKQREKVEN